MTWVSPHIRSRNMAGGHLMPHMKMQPASTLRIALDEADTEFPKIKLSPAKYFDRAS
jgi:hypothetical protein